ncbi:response regulator [Streptomyces sp. NPDC002623]
MDDNKVIRQLIRVNLELEGLEVVTASDGAECLDVVHQVRPDLVTLDVVMPRLDGLRTAARLRADPRTRDLPLVIISACTQYEVEAGLDVGVDAFLAKPFEPDELVSVVRTLLERARGSEGERGEGGEGSGGGGAAELDLGLDVGLGLGPGRGLGLGDNGLGAGEGVSEGVGAGKGNGASGGPSVAE